MQELAERVARLEEQAKRMPEIEKRLADVERTIWKACGGLAVLIVVLQGLSALAK